MGRNADFRSEVRTGESRRDTRDDLLWRQSSRSRIEMPEHDGRRFFLNGVHPDPVGVKREVPGPIARGRVHERYRGRSQGRGASQVQFPDVNPVLPHIGAHNPLIGGYSARTSSQGINSTVPASISAKRRSTSAAHAA